MKQTAMTTLTSPMPIDPARFYQALRQNGVTFYTGVPDSLLKDICAYITSNAGPGEHLIAANEGNAVGLAAGYHLSTGRIPLVYLQNSGLGNATNPLLSLADPQVYSLPIILLIGWRGEPGVKDEPQHIKQGRVQNALLDAMEVPYHVLDVTVSDVETFTAAVVDEALQRQGPVAIVVREKTFAVCKAPANTGPHYELLREAAIGQVLQRLPADAVVVSTTGKTSREVFECREQNGQGHDRDFLTVGSMGHCSQIALGMAMQRSCPVVCLDGDGAALMHLGGMALIGTQAQANLLHIVLNNGAHESVGGQPTVAFNIDLVAVAKACGYARALCCSTADELSAVMDIVYKQPSQQGATFVEIRVNQGSRADLGRPTTTPIQNKQALQAFLGLTD
jgi:phosphonopyruvate decarboxylase